MCPIFNGNREIVISTGITGHGNTGKSSFTAERSSVQNSPPPLTPATPPPHPTPHTHSHAHPKAVMNNGSSARAVPDSVCTARQHARSPAAGVPCSDECGWASVEPCNAVMASHYRQTAEEIIYNRYNW